MNDKINDIFISIGEPFSNNLDAKSKFIYNQYESGETETPDDIISNNSTGFKKKFIQISLPDNYFRNQDVEDFTELSEELEELRNIKVTKSNKRFFNFIEDIQDNRKNIILDYKKSYYKRFVNYYSSYNKEIDSPSSIMEGSSYTSISKEFFEENLELFYNTDVDLSEEITNLSSFDDFFKKTKVSLDIDPITSIQQGNCFPGFYSFSQELNFDDPAEIRRLIERNCVRCGIYLEKYEKIGESYNFIVGKFITKQVFEQNISNISTKIQDQNVKYGKTYRYVLRDVYLYTQPTYLDRFTLSNMLVCDFPFITSDIVCKEHTPPPPPQDIGFEYNSHDNEFLIKWERVYDNYQNDIKGFQILRRESLENPFELITQLEGHNNNDFYERIEEVDISFIRKTPGRVPYQFVDRSYDQNKFYIYTIRSIDAHGMLSEYSSQIGVLYDSFSEKLIIDVIVEKNSPVDQPNLKIKTSSIFFKEDLGLIDNTPVFKDLNKICLYFTPDYCKVDDDNSETVSNLYNSVQKKNYLFSIFKLNENIEHKKEFSIEIN